MKKLVCLLLILAIIPFVNGCSKDNQSNKVSDYYSYDKKQQDEKAIEEHIYANLPSDLYVLLEDIDRERLNIYINDDKEVYISFRTISDYGIPYVAKESLPIVMSAIEDRKLTLHEFKVWKYSKGSKGYVEDSIVSWNTKDGVKGVFISEQDNDYFNPNATIDDLLEYYKEYDEFVNKLRNASKN